VRPLPRHPTRGRPEAAAPWLDGTGIRRGEQFSLRWIMVQMIEEYARHNGHADLLRRGSTARGRLAADSGAAVRRTATNGL